MAKGMKATVSIVALGLLLFIAMYFLRVYLGFPPALFASCLLSVYLIYLTKTRWKKLNKIQKIALIWYLFGIFGLAIAYGIDYLIFPVRVTFLFFAAAILPPSILLAWRRNGDRKSRNTKEE